MKTYKVVAIDNNGIFGGANTTHLVKAETFRHDNEVATFLRAGKNGNVDVKVASYQASRIVSIALEGAVTLVKPPVPKPVKVAKKKCSCTHCECNKL